MEVWDPQSGTSLPRTYSAGDYDRGEPAIVEALAGTPEAAADLERTRTKMASIHGQGGDTNWSAILLLQVPGFLRDKATVDTMAGQSQPRIESDAVTAPALRSAIAVSRTHLGETKLALQDVKESLQTPGETCPTPALLLLGSAAKRPTIPRVGGE